MPGNVDRVQFRQVAGHRTQGQQATTGCQLGAGRSQGVDHLLRALGCQPSIELTKECENYRLQAGDRDYLATLVRLPEIEGTFLEVEFMTEPDTVGEALDAVRGVLAGLSVTAAELTPEPYTDTVRAVLAGLSVTAAELTPEPYADTVRAARASR